MSKQTKFLSIAIGLLQGMDEYKHDAVVNSMTAERLYEALKRHGLEDGPCEPIENKALGRILITVLDENKKGTPCQVKFFKLLEGEGFDDFDRVNGKITMSRYTTYYNGRLTADLEIGRYVVEISKGSEYEIITDHVDVTASAVICRDYELKRFIDLGALGWHAGDLHHHSVYSSPVWKGDDLVVESASDVALSMMAMGLTYGCLSDHHNVFNHDAWRKTQAKDFCPIVSKEISTSNGHVMSMGVEKDVIYAIPDDEHRTDEYLRGEFRRIVQEIKSEKGLAQLNHPRDLQRSISWNPDFYDMIDIFETLEIWNGSNPMEKGTTNDKALKLWESLLGQGRYIPATAGSDCHNTKADDYNVLFDEMVCLYQSLKDADYKEIEDGEELYCFRLIMEKVINILEKWAETDLTSGGVRTYVYLDNDLNPENVMDALRHGCSFLTDGPILFFKILGDFPGSRIKTHSNEAELEITLLSNRPVKTLEIHSDKGAPVVYDLQEETLTMSNGRFYDHSCRLNMDVADINWIYLIARDDCTNMAITNPIFLDK